MPVLIVYGIPAEIDRETLDLLASELQIEVSLPLCIQGNEVSVFFPAEVAQWRAGGELVCIIEGLFEKPERTPFVRQKVAKAALMPLLRLVSNRLRSKCKKVEVIVKRFDQYKDGFAVHVAGG